MKFYKSEAEFFLDNLERVFEREDLLQECCFYWSWQFLPETRRVIWHVPNGGDRKIVQAAQFKAMGVIPGVCDMHFNWANRLYIIELKVGVNLITDAQEQYIRAATKQGAIFYECRTFKKWVSIIGRILAGEPLSCEAEMLIKIRENGWMVRP
jgi:hypothetical protein